MNAALLNESASVSALLVQCPGVDIRTDTGTRAMYAFDASNYRVLPLAVAIPRTVEEIRLLARACSRTGIPITPRGGGTSMAGNAVGPGVVVDLSVHLRSIRTVEPTRHRVEVEAGVVLDQLNAELAPLHQQFAPDPSSHSRATIGGMIGNDACGNHSVRYGRTSGHVIDLDLVLADGALVRASRGGFAPVDADDIESQQRADQLNRDLRTLAAVNLAIIRTELGKISRQVSGYHLDNLLPENGFDVARSIAGTEGTCGLIVRATLRTVPTPDHTALLVIGYDDLVEAAEDVPKILTANPTAVEGIDARIVQTMRQRRGPESVTALPVGSAWLYVELDALTESAATQKAASLLADLRTQGRVRDARLIESAQERVRLWRVREDGAGLSARPSPTEQTWAGWEDAAVHPDHLAAYLKDFRELQLRHEITGVLYGHFGAGCVHVRLDFDLKTDEGIKRMRRFVIEAAALVVKHGGSVSGEHGDGRARGEVLAQMYSRTMLGHFNEFKRAFDPQGTFSPGIIVNPPGLTQDLIVVADQGHTSSTAFAFAEDGGSFADAVQRCVGVGRCRSDSGGVMCPSYRATHREKDSTRGRSRILQEMANGTLLPDRWHSTEVKEALDLCLSCKACSSDCPVGVDLATYKSEFLHHHYQRRIRPVSHYSLGWLPRWIAIAGWMPSIVNRALSIVPIQRTVARLGGVTTQRDLPKFARRRRYRARTPAGVDALVFADSFTRGFRPDLVDSARRTLQAAGLDTAVSAGACCAVTWITTGQLTTAKRVLAKTVQKLDSPENTPIIVLEPSCAAALRKDLPELVDTPAAHRVANRVVTFAGAIEQALDAGWSPPRLPTDMGLQTHCHEYAVFGANSVSRVLGRLGVAKVAESSGCCGLAGNFGFEAEHYEVSMAVAGNSLTALLQKSGAERPVIADGFSCATQIDHVTGSPRSSRHLAEVLDEAINPTFNREGTRS